MKKKCEWVVGRMGIRSMEYCFNPTGGNMKCPLCGQEYSEEKKFQEEHEWLHNSNSSYLWCKAQ